jgi:hypothetical protein
MQFFFRVIMRIFSIAMLVLTIAFGVQAKPITVAKLCKKARAEGRMGSLTSTECNCMYGQSGKYLDPGFQALLFDALYYGRDNMSKIASLGISQNKLLRQMKAFRRAAKKDCGIKF